MKYRVSMEFRSLAHEVGRGRAWQVFDRVRDELNESSDDLTVFEAHVDWKSDGGILTIEAELTNTDTSGTGLGDPIKALISFDNAVIRALRKSELLDRLDVHRRSVNVVPVEP